MAGFEPTLGVHSVVGLPVRLPVPACVDSPGSRTEEPLSWDNLALKHTQHLPYHHTLFIQPIIDLPVPGANPAPWTLDILQAVPQAGHEPRLAARAFVSCLGLAPEQLHKELEHRDLLIGSA